MGPCRTTGIRISALGLWVALTALLACGDDPGPAAGALEPESPLEPPAVTDPRGRVETERLFPTDRAPGATFDRCHYASPLAHPDEPTIIATVGGRVVGLHPETGAPQWQVDLPVPDGTAALAVATPAIVDQRLVVAYHVVPPGTSGVTGNRLEHRVAVVDLGEHRLDPEFPPVTLDGTWSTVDGASFDWSPNNALSRAELAHARAPGDDLGRIYVTMGNARDIQPWHGFAFELSLDDWRAGGAEAAIVADLVTTPEADCGPPGQSGSRQRICGGGLWSPSGWTVIERDDTFELVLAPGNGQLDLAREDYANTLMKVGPGLDFDPGCSEACADFDPDAPSVECTRSCRNLFIPRVPDDGSFVVSSGTCDGLGQFECWARLDYIGGSTPSHLVLPSGTETLLYPTKDGAAYLVDAEHLGTQFDREQLVAVCGTRDDSCQADWAGMIVTEPAIARVGEVDLALIPTFMPDRTHPAGVVAVRIDESEGEPRIQVVWRAPRFDTAAAVERFRWHPSRIGLGADAQGLEFAWIVEPGRSGAGRLLALRAWDGAIVEDRPLAGSGMRFTQPLVRDDRVYVPSCTNDGGPAWIEGYAIRSR
jgi:hypothetical protein